MSSPGTLLDGVSDLDVEGAISPERARDVTALVDQSDTVEDDVARMHQRRSSVAGAGGLRDVRIDDRFRASLGRDDPSLEPDRFAAQLRDRIEVVADEDDGAALSLCAVHPPDTLGLELRIAHCASTSSTTRMSGSMCAATEKARRRYMPEE